jgi:hypothetical protein
VRAADGQEAAGCLVTGAVALDNNDPELATGNRVHVAVLVRNGKGGKRREVGMDRWAWMQLDPWLEFRPSLPVGSLLCVIHGPTAGRHWEASAARKQLNGAAVRGSGTNGRIALTR